MAVRVGFEERLWSRVLKTETCWLWEGHADSGGYGNLRRQRRRVKAHRAVWELLRGPIPKGWVLKPETCWNKLCVNPDHYTAHPRKGAPLRERFWSKVRRGPIGSCWLWVAGTDGSGYGMFAPNGNTIGAHRVSWVLEMGEIPDGLCVLHQCDNPPCVNPTHLFLGTHQSNSDDKCRKGRQYHPVGEKNGRSKLLSADVKKIHELFLRASLSKEALGRQFGVSSTTIRHILTGETWPHLHPKTSSS